MKFKYINHGIIYAILATAAISCNGGGKTSEMPGEAQLEPDQIRVTAEQFQTNGMAMAQPELRSFGDVLEVSGTIDVPPESRAAVSAVYGGFVKSFSLLIGDRIRKGQLVATLENPEFLNLQQQYLEIREQLGYLESEFKRQQTLFAEKISSEKNFLQAESQYKTALARSAGLERQLTLLNISPASVSARSLSAISPIYAPISGSVTRVGVRQGAFVSQASEIVEIVNMDHVHLELVVYERDVARLREGQLIHYTLPELSDASYEARVHLISSALEEDRTVKVHAHLQGEQPENLLVGMYVQARIQTGDASAAANGGGPVLSVPESALVRQESGHFILVLETESETGYVFRKIPVSPGTVRNGIAPLPGLELPENARILTTGAFYLVQGP